MGFPGGSRFILTFLLAPAAAALAALQSHSAEPPALPEGVVAHLGDTSFRHPSPPLCIGFSPDGQEILTGGQDGILRVWDARSGKAVRSLSVEQATINSLSFTPGGKLVLASSEGRFRILNYSTFKEEVSRLGSAGGLTLSPDGSFVASISSEGVVVSEVGTELPKVELEGSGPVAFHPDGRRIAVANAAGKVTLYLLAGGKPLITWDHGANPGAIVFNKDGSRLATGSNEQDGTLQVWEMGKTSPVAKLKDVGEPRMWLNETQLAAGSKAGAGIYDISQKRWVRFVEHSGSGWSISGDGKQLAAIGSSSRVRLWDLVSGKPVIQQTVSFPDVALLHPAADGKSLLVVSGTGAYQWQLNKKEASSLGTLPASALVATVVRDRLAIATGDSILIYDSFDPAKLLAARPSRVITSRAARCKSIALSPDRATIAYSGEASRIVLADAATGGNLRELPAQTTAIGLAFSPDGSELACLGRDGILRYSSVPAAVNDEAIEHWKVRVQRGQRGGVAVSPDGKLIAVTSASQFLLVSTANGNILHTESRHQFDDGSFDRIAFSNDGRLLITGSAGPSGAVQVWDVAARSLVRRYSPGLGAITSLGIFPGDDRLATAGIDNSITVWSLPAGMSKNPPKSKER